MGGLVVLGVLGVLTVFLVAVADVWRSRPRSRARRNAYTREAYKRAWFNTYPHELADGTIVWQSVWHDHAMDDRRAAAD